MYIISWSDFIRYDADGNIYATSRNLPATDRNGISLWTKPLAPHSLENVGDKMIHIISTELKKNPNFSVPSYQYVQKNFESILILT
ncbi:hypothetical protein D0X99_00680 [Algoriphagus lacus]|uniref:Uncharacterized protein n=1 Tax=Algoriphagus lacus TaxID=2056311 RepID=A0A418PVN9_9BACT|nr:hypothetical protein [Algoriphagus lacus]RIW18247.1 hypothetical protein D0X99_00680 [Algoriphagus lacus]